MGGGRYYVDIYHVKIQGDWGESIANGSKCLLLNAPLSMVIKSESTEYSETAIQLCTNEHIHY